MRNLLKKLTQKPVAVLTALLVAGAVIATPTVFAQTGTYTGNGKPQFNIYGDVSGVGDESDFLRIGPKGAAQNQFTNQQTVCSGEADLWVYIHNGAPEEYNGSQYNGSGIANDSKLKVQIPSAAGKDHTLNGTISASNAASVSDTAKLVCGSHEVSVKYVAGSAVAWSEYTGTVKLSDNVVTTGATIGSKQLDGKVKACWEYRIWVKLTVKVEKKEKPEEKPSTAICRDIVTTKSDGRTIKVTVNGETENATIVDYEIDFGDGTKVSEQTASHTYDKDGTYQIVGRVKVRFANGTEKWITANDCKTEVKFETPDKPEECKPGIPVGDERCEEQPEECKPGIPVGDERCEEKPEIPEMPKTGAAGLIGLFSGVSAAGALGHRLFISRRLNK